MFRMHNRLYQFHVSENPPNTISNLSLSLKPSRRSLRFLSSRQAVNDAAAFMKSMSEEHDIDDAWVSEINQSIN